MAETGRAKKGLRQLRDAAGYSLVEMIVATAIAAIVGLGLYAIFNSQQKSATSQKLQIDLQTSCGMAMDQMKQELLLAGYRGEETSDKSFSAVHHKVGDMTGNIFDQITFEYFDDKAKYYFSSTSTDPRHDPGLLGFDPVNYTGHTQIRYELSGDNLLRHYARLDGLSSTYANAAPQVLASGVQNLEFELFSNSGQLLNPVTLDEIRSIGIKLTCQSPKTDKLTGRTPTITLTASVQPRNVGLEANPRDTTAPGPPTNIYVWDPGVCGELRMRWDANTEADLAGYTILYGLDAGVYSNRARISRAPKATGAFEEFTLSGLTPTKYTDAVQATYHIVVTAFDKSSNQSANSSPEISGVGTPPSTRTFAAIATTGNDTTISLDPAPASAGFTATPGAENQINLSWPTATVAGLLGYRLYRGTSDSFVPDDTPLTGNLLADQAVLDPTATSWTDPGTDPHGPLQGCTPYHYKLAAIHCDTTIPSASLVFATATAMPTDTTDPPTPVLTARPGYKRIILSLKNPSAAEAPDFKETKIWFSKADYPTLTDGTSIDGTLLPDKEPYTAANTAGTFTLFSSRPSINFNSQTNGAPGYYNPELTGDATYYFIAVAYDKCGKHSAVTGEAKAEGAQCNDCLDASDGPPATAREICYDAPPAPENLRAEGCAGTLKISWDYPYLSQTEVYRDLTGFHVFRCEGWICPGGGISTAEVELTRAAGAPKGEPTWETFWEDDTVVEGQEYTYRIQATDCFYERRDEWPLPGDDLNNSPFDNAQDKTIPESSSTGLYTGRFIRQYRDIGVSTKLTNAFSIGATTVTVVSTVGFVGSGNTIKIDDELIKFTGTTATSFTGCTRAQSYTPTGDPTIEVTHDAGSWVNRWPPILAVGAQTGGLGKTPPDLRHNSVSITMESTAGSLLASPGTRILTFNQFAASWQNVLAYLKSLVVGDDSTTPLKTSFTETPPLTHDSTGGNVTLVATPIDGDDTLIPLAMTFARQNGTVDTGSNMREEKIDLRLGWWNNSTATQCPTSITPTLVSVPLGPLVDNVTMDKPTAGTLAYQVPGGGATANPPNILIVPGGVKVNVFANVDDTSHAGIKQVRLYYFVDTGRTLTTTPPIDSVAVFPVLTPYTRVFMEYVAGNQWRTPVGSELPVSDGSNVWFFIVATDNHGNFDREPELDSGAFQYYQQQVDVCANHPNPPGLTGSADASGVTLTITLPTNNTPATGGGPYTDHVGYKVFRKLNNGAYTQVGGTIVTAASPYTWPSTPDAPPDFNVAGNDYSYYVVAYDSCTPANVSDASTIFTECMNASPCTITVTPSAWRLTLPGSTRPPMRKVRPCGASFAATCEGVKKNTRFF